MKNIPMPEFLQGRKDIPNGPWMVEELRSGIGGSTDIIARHMIVPVGSSDLARSIRAHEMMHARISPPDKDVILKASTDWGYSPTTIEVAEEYRVNCMIHAAGFSVDAMADGSHSHLGKVWAGDGNWDSLVHTAALFAGFKPTADLLRGVKQVNDTYHKTLLALIKELKAKVAFRKLKTDRNVPSNLGSTKPVAATFGGDIPDGFRHVRRIAQIIDKYLQNDPTNDPATEHDESTSEGSGDSEAAEKTAAGEFANLLWANIELKPFLKGNILQKRIASDIGRNPRRISRALTDGKVFDRKIRRNGGIVIIDQSGSMHLAETDVHEMIKAAPGCTIVGYSHSAGSTNVPNVWILAQDGKIAEHIPNGNTGNGVDGPILEWAITKRRKGEPLIWVCDGIVTDGEEDICYQHLTDHCAKLVAKHKIHMVNDPEEAIAAIKHAATGKPLRAQGTGSIEHAMNSMK
jgi:hypothetical protein